MTEAHAVHGYRGPSVAARPQLRALAERVGILPSYQPMAGAPRRLTRDATRELLLAAMGVDASSEAAAKRVLAAFEEREAGRLLAPVRVEALGTRRAARLPVRWPAAAGARVDWRLELCEESGRRSTLEGRASLAGARPPASLPLPPPAEPGYHRLRLVVDGGGECHEAEQRFIACAPRCYEVHEALGRGKAFGLLANLYGVRSRRNWGVGDLGDLRPLVRLAAEVGAAFVGVNPLHASRSQGVDVSPYSPVSRLFRNEIYLAVEAIPELRECPAARRRIADPRFSRELERLRQRAEVAYDEVRAAKREVLQQLHRVFAARHREANGQRGRAYARFRARQDPALTGFATFVALGEQLERGRALCRLARLARALPRSALARGAALPGGARGGGGFPPLGPVRARAPAGPGAPRAAAARVSRSASTTTSPSAARRRGTTPGPSATSSPAARASGPLPTLSPSAGRTGRCPRSYRSGCWRAATTTGSGCCGPSSPTAARCASTT